MREIKWKILRNFNFLLSLFKVILDQKNQEKVWIYKIRTKWSSNRPRASVRSI